MDRYTRPEVYLIGGDDRFEALALRGHPFDDGEELEKAALYAR